MKHAVLIDFGSTFTKLAVACFEQKKIIFTAKFPSTVRTDARVGLKQCFDAARQVIGEQAFKAAIKLSSSSAAGGLRMAVIGLTPTLSITAGRNAAFGAGAKILGSFSGMLSREEVMQLEKMDTEIILLCGGYENGNKSMVLHNAQAIADSSITSPVIFAGNSVVASTVRGMFINKHKECFVVKNIIPNVGMLDTQSTEEVIRNVFLKRIINMKGLDKIKGSIDQMLMPTPAAVLEAGELLALGTDSQDGLGPLMIVDIGGATTDIHTYIEQKSYSGAKIMGAAEPFAKRTVEGDMGMRESSICLMHEVGSQKLAYKVGIPAEQLEASINMRINTTKFVADTQAEMRVDQEIASAAAYISARRHAGHIEYVHSSNCNVIQLGKNLTELRTVVGTGGPIINSMSPKQILKQVLADPIKEAETLLPNTASFFVDRDYVFFAAGLLKQFDKDLALSIMKNSLQRL